MHGAYPGWTRTTTRGCSPRSSSTAAASRTFPTLMRPLESCASHIDPQVIGRRNPSRALAHRRATQTWPSGPTRPCTSPSSRENRTWSNWRHETHRDGPSPRSTWAIRKGTTGSSSPRPDRRCFRTRQAIDRFDRVQVAYYARLVGELRYAIRMPAGWIRETADTGGVVGWYTSLAADRGGLPRISYYDWTNGDLKYTEGAIALSVRTHRPLQTSVPRTTLEGEIVSLGTHASAETRFAIRPAGTTTWNYTAPQVTDHAGRFTVTISNLTAGQRSEYRADSQSGNESATGDVVAFVVPLPLQPAPPYLLFIVGGLGAAAFVVIAIWFFYRKGRAGRVPIIEPGGTRPSVPAAVRGTPDRRHRRGRPSRWDTGDGSGIRTAGPRGLAARREGPLGGNGGSPDPGQGWPSSVP